jgi:hypothetical protein
VRGKEALLAKERAFLPTVAEWHRREAVHVLVTGDCTAIQWRFELTGASGERMLLEEVAIQEWTDEGGAPKIKTERYFPLPPVILTHRTGE